MSFATAINCMDGRTQLPVIEHIKTRCGVAYVDSITEPGPNLILAEGVDKAAVESIMRRVDVSVHRHGSRVVAIVGHQDCAGNPADRPAQIEHLQAASAELKRRFPQVDVLALWVGEDWRVEELSFDG